MTGHVRIVFHAIRFFMIIITIARVKRRVCLAYLRAEQTSFDDNNNNKRRARAAKKRVRNTRLLALGSLKIKNTIVIIQSDSDRVTATVARFSVSDDNTRAPAAAVAIFNVAVVVVV